MAKPNAAFCRSISRQLQRWLEESNLVTFWAPQHDLLFWVLFITAHISIGEAEWPWILSHLSTLIDFLSLQSVDEMEAVLNGFYYHPRFFRVTAEKIWAGKEHFLSN